MVSGPDSNRSLPRFHSANDLLRRKLIPFYLAVRYKNLYSMVLKLELREIETAIKFRNQNCKEPDSAFGLWNQNHKEPKSAIGRYRKCKVPDLAFGFQNLDRNRNQYWKLYFGVLEPEIRYWNSTTRKRIPRLGCGIKTTRFWNRNRQSVSGTGIIRNRIRVEPVPAIQSKNLMNW